jgi:hypothetical protein
MVRLAFGVGCAAAKLPTAAGVGAAWQPLQRSHTQQHDWRCLLGAAVMRLCSLFVPVAAALLTTAVAPALPVPAARAAGCTASLQRTCGADRASVFACAECAGAHQRALQQAGCSNHAISSWCAGIDPPQPNGSRLHQERVLIVTRHGIRVPFAPIEHQPATVFSRDPTREWFADPQAWGAAKIAELTPHGKDVISIMGAHMVRKPPLWSHSCAQTISLPRQSREKHRKYEKKRRFPQAEVVLPPTPYNFTVYADLDHTRRDIQTAEAFMRGAYPEANFSVGPWGEAHPDYLAKLMNQGNVSTARCPVSGDLEAVIAGEVGGDFARCEPPKRGLSFDHSV